MYREEEREREVKRRKFLSWLAIGPLVAVVPAQPVRRILCLKRLDGTVVKYSFEGRDIEAAQNKAVRWLEHTLRDGDEIMITNPDMHYIWPGEVR